MKHCYLKVTKKPFIQSTTNFHKPISVDGWAPFVLIMNLSATTKVIGGDNIDVPLALPAFTTSSYSTDGVRSFRVTVVSSVSSFCALLNENR